MKENLISPVTRLIATILAGVTFVAALWTQDRVSEAATKRQAQERLLEKLQGQVDLLRRERRELAEGHARELAQLQGWLDRVVVPRDSILRNAKRDAAERGEVEIDRCFAEATLEKDGWNVTCGYDLCTLGPPKFLRYVLDPMTGRILSFQYVESFQRD